MSSGRIRSPYVGLLGLVLVVGLLLFLRATHRNPPPPPPVAATPASRPMPAPRPTASAEELAGLSSPDPYAQRRAVNALLERGMTPELAEALGRARPVDPSIAGGIDCLKSRVPGVSLDWMIGRLPELDCALGSRNDDCICMVESLSARIDEAPERLAEALFPYALKSSLSVRSPALEALSKTRFERVPPWAQAEIARQPLSVLVVHAAFALRIEELDPARVEQWIVDPKSSSRAATRKALVSSSSPQGARLLARALVQHREEELLHYLFERERARHDALSQLVEIAVDESADRAARSAALEYLGQYGRPEDVARLEPLASGSDDVLRAYATAALVAIQKRSR